jgi:hypothetical protein
MGGCPEQFDCRRAPNTGQMGRQRQAANGVLNVFFVFRVFAPNPRGPIPSLDKWGWSVLRHRSARVGRYRGHSRSVVFRPVDPESQESSACAAYELVGHVSAALSLGGMRLARFQMVCSKERALGAERRSRQLDRQATGAKQGQRGAARLDLISLAKPWRE